MDQKKLRKIRGELGAMRLKQVTAADVQSVAKQLGRRLENHGKHPIWENESFPNRNPLSIPDHGGRDLSKRVRTCVLNELEEDADAWEAWLDSRESSNGHDTH